MAKDPAFLFYSQDFLVGTEFFSNEQAGKYIRLLCLQHQHGRLDERHMLHICGTYDKHIFSKFKRDTNGCYYNERLEKETVKRKNYCESRRKNRNSKTTYVEDMENENTNNNNNDIEKTQNPQNVEFPIENCKDIALKDQRWCEKNKITPKDLDEFNAWLEKGGVYQHHVGEYKTYYRNWRNSKKKHIEPSKPLKPFSHV